MDKSTFFNSVEDFCKITYGDDAYIQQSQDRAWVQIFLGEDIEFYPFVSSDNKIKVDQAFGFEYLNINIYPDGNADFFLYGYQPDGIVEDPEYQDMYDTCFNFYLERVEDIGDIVDFIKKICLDKNSTVERDLSFTTKNWKDIVEDTFIFIPSFSKKLVPYNKLPAGLSIEQIKRSFDGLKFISVENSVEESQAILKGAKNKIAERKKEFEKLLNGHSVDFQINDIFIRLDGNDIRAFYGYYEIATSELEVFDEIYLVIRPVKNVSQIALWDFLSSTPEGEKILIKLIRGESIEPFVYLENKFEQTQYLLEHRTMQYRFKRKVLNLLHSKEPFAIKNELANNRLSQVEDFYSQKVI